MKTPANYYSIEDVKKLTGYQYTACQKIVQRLNEELKAAGRIIIPGIVPKKYYRLRYGLEGIEDVALKQMQRDCEVHKNEEGA
jgi:hypothetical protein